MRELPVDARTMRRPELAPPPRWAVRCAWLVPLTILPSAVWRTSLLFGHGHPLGAVTEGGWYLLVLGAVSLGLGLSTVGLVRPWGAICPSWLPLAGGTLLILGCLYATANIVFGRLVDVPQTLAIGGESFARPGAAVLSWYAPMLAWGPLLIAVALNYRRRRLEALASC